MGLAPPTDFYSIQNAVMQSDTNFNGRVSKMEMFNLFKRIQFNQQMGGMGMGMNQGFNNGWNQYWFVFLMIAYDNIITR